MIVDTEAPELRDPEEKPELPVAPENLEDPAPENLEELSLEEPSPEELVKPAAPENLEEGTETDLETDPLLREAMACWIAGVSWVSTCPTAWRVGWKSRISRYNI